LLGWSWWPHWNLASKPVQVASGPVATARQPLAVPGARAARVRAAVRSALRERHSERPVRHSGYAAGVGAWPVPRRLRAASELARLSAVAGQARGSAGSVVSAEQAAAPRPAVPDAAAVPRPEAARAALAVPQREAPVVAAALRRAVGGSHRCLEFANVCVSLAEVRKAFFEYDVTLKLVEFVEDDRLREIQAMPRISLAHRVLCVAMTAARASADAIEGNLVASPVFSQHACLRCASRRKFVVVRLKKRSLCVANQKNASHASPEKLRFY